MPDDRADPAYALGYEDAWDGRPRRSDGAAYDAGYRAGASLVKTLRGAGFARRTRGEFVFSGTVSRG